MAITAAYNAQVRLNASVALAFEWDVETDGGLFDATTFEDAGFGRDRGGVRRAQITIKGFWDPAANPHANPPQIIDAKENTNMLLYATGTGGGLSWNFPNYIIQKVKMMTQVREGLKFDFDSKSQGSFTYPGGYN